MARLFPRMIALGKKLDFELELHYIDLSVANPLEIEIQWVKKRETASTKKRLTVYPGERRVDINETLRVKATLFKTAIGKYLTKKVRLRVLGHGASNKDIKIGLVDIKIKDLSEIPMKYHMHSLEKCFDPSSVLCVSVFAQDPNQQPLEIPMEDLSSVIQELKINHQNMVNQLESLTIKMKEPMNKAKNAYEDVEYSRQQTQELDTRALNLRQEYEDILQKVQNKKKKVDSLTEKRYPICREQLYKKKDNLTYEIEHLMDKRKEYELISSSTSNFNELLNRINEIEEKIHVVSERNNFLKDQVQIVDKNKKRTKFDHKLDSLNDRLDALINKFKKK